MITGETLEGYLQFVEAKLESYGHNKGDRHCFRIRSRHIRRVMKWAERLAEGLPNVDMDVLMTAAAFHDCGYRHNDETPHAILGAGIFRDYAAEHGFDPVFTEKVATAIEIHSDKERMKHPEDMTMEQILLIEADLMDEEGAMGICWDALAVCTEGDPSYDAAYQRSAAVRDKVERRATEIGRPWLVTDRAKRIWAEKQAFRRQYVDMLKEDLVEWHADSDGE